MNYKTISGRATAEYCERRSQFIGYLCHVETNDEAVNFINDIRTLHRRATHNVYAYILREGNTVRYSDDGEPQGTAGVPVLEILKKTGLTDVCCVVTRYFGGILLGGGGLVRAYSHSASAAVEAAEIMHMCRAFRIEIIIDYSLYGKILPLLGRFDIKIENSEFSDIVRLCLLVREENFIGLSDMLSDITNGTAKIKKSELIYENFN